MAAAQASPPENGLNAAELLVDGLVGEDAGDQDGPAGEPLSCMVCREPYAADRIPFTLSACGHGLCQPCLKGNDKKRNMTCPKVTEVSALTFTDFFRQCRAFSFIDDCHPCWPLVESQGWEVKRHKGPEWPVPTLAQLNLDRLSTQRERHDAFLRDVTLLALFLDGHVERTSPTWKASCWSFEFTDRDLERFARDTLGELYEKESSRRWVLNVLGLFWGASQMPNVPVGVFGAVRGLIRTDAGQYRASVSSSVDCMALKAPHLGSQPMPRQLYGQGGMQNLFANFV